MSNPISNTQLSAWSASYHASPERQMATLALSKHDLNEVSYSPADGFAMTRSFSVDIPTLPVTDQQRSGRCWLFAACNILREHIANALNLESFELSQSFLAFWDKFERCNYFLESLLETASLPTDDRTVAFLLKTGAHDGGQWEMFANIVRKYGILPKAVYNETFQSSHTAAMNAVLNRNLKICAARLRRLFASGADAEALQAEKERMLQAIYGFLCSCYTEPPKSFDFEYVDKEKLFHAERDITPLQFYEKYVGDLLDRCVSIIHAPTADKPFGKTFTIRYLGNVVGGRRVCHLNLTMEDFKAAIIRQLEAGKVVWFGADVGKFGEREKGVWDDRSFNAPLLTGLDLAISKADALDYWYSSMNHAMVITGVNLVDGKPNRWKIENSWGDKNGEKGYYVCSDSWFDQYVFQAAVEREYLGELAELAGQEPVELAPWDPMGTLAE